MYKSIILPLVKQDIKEAATWYNERQPGLGKQFTDHVRKTVHYIRQNPKAVAQRYNNVRTALLDTFPYMIHFAVDDEKKVLRSLPCSIRLVIRKHGKTENRNSWPC